MIKNVLFDMDMTILDFNMAERQALSGALAALGAEPTEELLQAYHEINKAQWKLLEQGQITRERLKIRRFEILFETFGIAASPEKGASCYEPRLAQGYFYMDGAENLLQSLQGAYRLYIVSNGSSDIQHSRIAGADLKKYFDGIYISEDIGYNKPDKRFFDACFSDIEKTSGEAVALSETIIIGDSLSSDIMGGKNAGIRTVWFHPKGTVCDGIFPDYEVTELHRIPDLLRRISLTE